MDTPNILTASLRHTAAYPDLHKGIKAVSRSAVQALSYHRAPGIPRRPSVTLTYPRPHLHRGPVGRSPPSPAPRGLHGDPPAPSGRGSEAAGRKRPGRRGGGGCAGGRRGRCAGGSAGQAARYRRARGTHSRGGGGGTGPGRAGREAGPGLRPWLAPARPFPVGCCRRELSRSISTPAVAADFFLFLD